MHAALRQVLGPAALQAGSDNTPGYLRFDFAWRSGLSTATRSEIEEVANVAIRDDLPVSARVMPIAEARAIGAMALFGEKYGDEVRVVEIGGDWSRELCGGTHVAHSAQIGALAVTAEASIGSGPARRGARRHRRVPLPGPGARPGRPGSPSCSRRPARSWPTGSARRWPSCATPRRSWRSCAPSSCWPTSARSPTPRSTWAGWRWSPIEAPEGTSGNDVRTLAQEIRAESAGRPAVVAVASRAGGKASLVVAVNPAAKERGLDAGELVKGALSGRGGGNADLAQGGGVPADQVPALLAGGGPRRHGRGEGGVIRAKRRGARGRRCGCAGFAWASMSARCGSGWR